MRVYYARSCEDFEKILWNEIRFLPVNSTSLRKRSQEFVILGAVGTALEFNYRFRPSSWDEFFQQNPFYQFHGSEEVSKRNRGEIGRENWSRGVGKYPFRRFRSEGRRLDEPKISFTSFNMPSARVICYQIAIDRPFPFLSVAR